MESVVGRTFYFDFEIIFMEWLQNLFGEAGANIFSHISAIGDELFFVLVLGFLWWCYDKKVARSVGIGMTLGIVLNPMIKNVFFRRRPYFDNESIKCFRPVDKSADIYDIAAQGFSFPSGHSTNSVVMYGGIARNVKNKVLAVLAVVLPLLIGLSRIAVGVHYPTDVLCGWLLGIGILVLMSFLEKTFPEEKSWLMELIIFAIAFLGVFYCKSNDYYTGLGMMAGYFLTLEFEKRFVNFKNTRNVIKCILRIVCGMAIFFVLNTLLKLPFSAEFLESATTAAFLVRAGRYCILTFGVLGLYPIVFDRFIKLEG